MHALLFVTTNKDRAENSEEARSYVYEELINDNSFCGEGGRFSCPIADWFVIGGRWSGKLSRLTWANEVTEQIAKMEKEEKIQIWGVYYSSDEDKERQSKLRERVEELYKEATPQIYKDKGLIYDRNTYDHYGYEDDAMIVTEELYEKILKEHEGWSENEYRELDGVNYVDLEYDCVSREFIGSKWVVVVDYHS